MIGLHRQYRTEQYGDRMSEHGVLETKHEIDFHNNNNFTLEKGRLGIAKRKVNIDCLYGVKKPQIEKHIHKVLSRISFKGK